jgi:hypothetical protein
MDANANNVMQEKGQSPHEGKSRYRGQIRIMARGQDQVCSCFFMEDFEIENRNRQQSEPLKNKPQETMNKKSTRILWLIGVLLLNSGCAAVYDFYVSKANNLGPKGKSWANGVVVEELEDIRLVLQLNNQTLINEGGWFILPFPIMGQRKEVFEKYRKDNSFEIELAMKSYGENFTFNPKQVYLRFETGGLIQASKYYKPDFVLSAPNPNCGIMHGWTVPPASNDDPPQPELLSDISHSFEAPKHKWIGFRIYFDAPTPNPGTQFSIIIRGLKRAEKNVPVEEIEFKEKKIYRDSISS